MTPRDTSPTGRKAKESFETRAETAKAEAMTAIEEALARTTAAFGKVKEDLADRRDFVRHRVEDSPLEALGTAAGVGFIVGGGIFTPPVGRLFNRALVMGLIAGLAYTARAYLLDATD